MDLSNLFGQFSDVDNNCLSLHDCDVLQFLSQDDNVLTDLDDLFVKDIDSLGEVFDDNLRDLSWFGWSNINWDDDSLLMSEWKWSSDSSDDMETDLPFSSEFLTGLGLFAAFIAIVTFWIAGTAFTDSSLNLLTFSECSLSLGTVAMELSHEWFDANWKWSWSWSWSHNMNVMNVMDMSDSLDGSLNMNNSFSDLSESSSQDLDLVSDLNDLSFLDSFVENVSEVNNLSSDVVNLCDQFTNNMSEALDDLLFRVSQVSNNNWSSLNWSWVSDSDDRSSDSSDSFSDVFDDLGEFNNLLGNFRSDRCLFQNINLMSDLVDLLNQMSDSLLENSHDVLFMMGQNLWKSIDWFKDNMVGDLSHDVSQVNNLSGDLSDNLLQDGNLFVDLSCFNFFNNSSQFLS